MAAPAYPVILWTDDPAGAKPLRDAWNADDRKTVIRDARMFDGVCEHAKTIAFKGAVLRDQIVAGYQSEAYRSLFGDVKIIDVPDEVYSEPEAIPALPEEPVEPVEPTAAEIQIESLDDDALRAMIQAETGKRPHHLLGREKLIGMVREGKAD